MFLKDTPIQRKLMMVILLTTVASLLLIYVSFFSYEYFSFRKSMKQQISILSEVIANNSTAALAFYDKENAMEILSALKAEKHIVAACLYDGKGNLFSCYPSGINENIFPKKTGEDGFVFENSHLIGFREVRQGDKHLGTLYLSSDLNALYDGFKLYSAMAGLLLVITLLLAYFISKKLQEKISKPILVLADTARSVSENQDYSVRAEKYGKDELGLLTDSFNRMLSQIEKQNFEIVTFNRKLEMKVVERTKELETANKELESFSYSISHDLRAPLRILNGYAEILSTEHGSKLDEEAKRVVGVIMRNSKRMGQLIDDILDLSRFGRTGLVTQKVAMDSLVRSIIADENIIQSDEKTEITVLPLADATCDLNLIRQVWINLISNAIKYSSKRDKAIIEIGCKDLNDTVVYYVKDNGAGFDMQYADKLFGVFQRLHKTTDFEGTGIGLAIVQTIVSKHGGNVWAFAEKDQGATFYFSLSKNEKQY